MLLLELRTKSSKYSQIATYVAKHTILLPGFQIPITPEICHISIAALCQHHAYFIQRRGKPIRAPSRITDGWNGHETRTLQLLLLCLELTPAICKLKSTPPFTPTKATTIRTATKAHTATREHQRALTRSDPLARRGTGRPALAGVTVVKNDPSHGREAQTASPLDVDLGLGTGCDLGGDKHE
jgi:hypothetical protein